MSEEFSIYFDSIGTFEFDVLLLDGDDVTLARIARESFHDIQTGISLKVGRVDEQNRLLDGLRQFRLVF